MVALVVAVAGSRPEAVAIVADSPQVVVAVVVDSWCRLRAEEAVASCLGGLESCLC